MIMSEILQVLLQLIIVMKLVIQQVYYCQEELLLLLLAKNLLLTELAANKELAAVPAQCGKVYVLGLMRICMCINFTRYEALLYGLIIYASALMDFYAEIFLVASSNKFLRC